MDSKNSLYGSRARIGLEITYPSPVFVGHGGNRAQLCYQRALPFGYGLSEVMGAKKPACISHGGLGGRFELTLCKRSVVQFHIGGQHIKPAVPFPSVLVAFVFMVVFQQSPV